MDNKVSSPMAQGPEALALSLADGAFGDVFAPSLRLHRRDLLLFEQHLRAALAAFFPFSAYSLHFPAHEAGRAPDYILEEERLLLPLYEPHPLPPPGGGKPEAQLLGVFVARGVPEQAYAGLAGCLQGIAALVMENLYLYKASLCDAVTGIFSREPFLARLAREVRGTGDVLRPQESLAREIGDTGSVPAGAGDAVSGGHPCFGILAIRLHGLRQIVRRHGYLFADSIMALMGEALTRIVPEQGLTARISDHELAVLVPAATAKRCRRLAASIVEAVNAVAIPHELTRSRVHAGASVGYALYPQDVSGGIFMKPAGEQARIMLRKARLAAALAAEKDIPGPGGEAGGPILGFGRILAEGGRVVEPLPLSRVLVSLGSGVNAREGQRFSVWSRGGEAQGTYKGEIVLLQVRESTSVAEIIHQGDPSWGIEPGDELTLLPEEVWGASRAASLDTDAGEEAEAALRRDPLTGLLRHGDFLARWSALREQAESFSLSLVRIAFPTLSENHDTGAEDAESGFSAKPEQLMGEAVRLFRDVFGPETVGGRYGLTSMMFYHPNELPESVQARYEEFAVLVAKRLFPNLSGKQAAGCVSVGLAGYPYLDFRKADVLENCRKALEYGALLPAPHVGVFDSLAMTISADKRFSHGDILGAMTEYKQALLADETNALAWNSLGVSLARLGRHDEARGHFDKAVALDESDAMALYNMGYSCQCLGERSEAKSFYARCLEKDPAHMYAFIRQGQLAESEGAHDEARALYGKAGEIAGGKALTRRYLAGLSLREGKSDEAREYLHEALSLDPHNSVALHMLASIYLDGGEDAAVAESLARQSVALNPGLKSGWLVLARALEQVGKPGEAREAAMRAGEM